MAKNMTGDDFVDTSPAASTGYGRLYGRVAEYLRLEGQLYDLQQSQRQLRSANDRRPEIVHGIEDHYQDEARRQSNQSLVRNSRTEQEIARIKTRLAAITTNLLQDGTIPPDAWVGLEDGSRYVRVYEDSEGAAHLVCVAGEAVRSAASGSFGDVLRRQRELGLYPTEPVRIPGWFQAVPRALGAAAGGAVLGLCGVYVMWFAVIVMLAVGGAEGGPSTMTEGTPTALLGAILFTLFALVQTLHGFHKERAFKQRLLQEMENSTLPISGASSISNALGAAEQAYQPGVEHRSQ